MSMSDQIPERELNDSESKFDPPLYIQRYEHVCDVIQGSDDHKVLMVADFGCSNCKMLKYMKKIKDIRKLIGVDIDRNILKQYSFRIEPSLWEHVHVRSSPLTTQLFCGSIAEFDKRLADVDAVTMVEVIEHLPPEMLSAFPDILFGQLHPYLVVITTPNSEYNVVFKDLVGMRHWDHKFEWTREEFENWCDRIASQYNYSVKFSGVGDPPPTMESVGFCSQIGVFTSNDQLDRSNTDNNATMPYELVAEVKYPWKPEQSRDEQLLNEVRYYISFLSRNPIDGESESIGSNTESDAHSVASCDSNTIVVHLEELLSYSKINVLCNSIEELRCFILGAKEWQLNDSGTAILLPSDFNEESPDTVSSDTSESS
ncbi:PREDICTED: small RNA 2'-O-methyltransferase-like [Priapulus caudatus]|uniref:Small RNA 2'-O-methyltransferase n=1 Tax=Priapulus caudatus TaxID=37621 RepID=A0ABM1E2V2_PRICU|nr:PREDICTED: small RNA 2'-O-methyltransferase-like [Priapulus caudatus]XP_014666524.1 PREDICTED: small RNA 2'-O-methyltransferase-like [Priapulus caudatus]